MKSPSVSFVSLGCPKNLVDSEKMLGLLAEGGCSISAPGLPADVLVVNTCGFLDASRDEALRIIQEAAERKRAGEIKRLVVAGCLVQRDGRGLAEEVPEIDALVGVNNREDILRAVTNGQRHAARRDGPRVFLAEYHPLRKPGWSDQARLRLTPKHYAYVRISEGCDQKCTFCTIPSIRGPMHSKTPAQIKSECTELVADGARELILIGQDTTSYGRDLGGKTGLAGLLRELDRLEGVRWIRLMYVYPTEVGDDLIEAIADGERVVKYVDIPLQHINDRVLKAMHRRIDRRGTEALLHKLRTRIPGVALRTTFIAGYPGETDAEFAELLEFVRVQRFDAVGVFPYSCEPGTPAARMKNSVKESVRKSRVDDLMRAQQVVAFEKAEAAVGRRLRVVVEDFGRKGEHPARHAGQAPEIDSLTYVEGGELEPGDEIDVRVRGRRGYDLTSRPVRASLPVLR